MAPAKIPGLTAAPSPLRGYLAMGRELLSDFHFVDLPGLEVTEAPLVVRRDPRLRCPTGRPLRELADDGGVRVRIWESERGLFWEIVNVGRFWAAPDGSRVSYAMARGASHRDVEHWLVGPVLGVALQQQGAVLLHAGAVLIDSRAVAFSAPPGHGKSTLAAAFARAGTPIFSDDVLPVEADRDPIRAWPYLPKMKLWSDSVEALSGDASRYERALSWVDKRRVKVEDGWGAVATEPAPLGSFYLLAPSAGPPDSAGSVASDGAISFEQLAPAEAAVELVGAMFGSHILSGRRAHYAFDAAARIADSVLVRVVRYRRSFDILPALRQAIERDAREMRDARERVGGAA